MRIGIIICDRYRTCGGGKCLRSVRERVGAFSIYPVDEPLEVVGYTTCDGCPGGNVEHVPEEMINNGADAIHLATGMIVGYPPCPHMEYFQSYITERYGLPVVAGTHPIPEKYRLVHAQLSSWPVLAENDPLMATEEIRLAYD